MQRCGSKCRRFFVKNLNVLVLAVLALLVSSGSVFAHHGTAGSYDHNKVVTVKGVVKEFRWRNPHAALFIVARDQSGDNEVTYALEIGSPGSLVKRGYTRNTFKAGDEIVIQIHPSFTNPVNGVDVDDAPVLINGKEIRQSVPEQ